MSLVDYSELEKEIENAPEPKTLPSGTEVKARIVAVNSGLGEYGKWYRVRFDIPSEPLAHEFTDFFSDLLDAKEGPEKNYAAALRKFRAFAVSFNIDFGRPIDWESDLDGLEGWLILGVKKSDEYGEQNTVKKYLGRNQAATKENEVPF